MKNNQKGFVEVLATLFVLALIVGFFCFSVRASEATYVNQETKSTYCVPKNSPYKELVNRAAADKRVKVTVSARKYFTVKAPWTVYPNVVVSEVK